MILSDKRLFLRKFNSNCKIRRTSDYSADNHLNLYSLSGQNRCGQTTLSPSPENVPRYSLVSLRRVMMPTSAGSKIAPIRELGFNQNSEGCEELNGPQGRQNDILKRSNMIERNLFKRRPILVPRKLQNSNSIYEKFEENSTGLSLPPRSSFEHSPNCCLDSMRPKRAALVKLVKASGDVDQSEHRNTLDLIVSQQSFSVSAYRKVTLDLDSSIRLASKLNCSEHS